MGKKKKMISYTIDQSIFNPPAIPFIENKNEFKEKIIDEYNENIIKYYYNINKVKDIKDIEKISIYLFRFSKKPLDNEYARKAKNISGLPIDKLKIISDKLIDSYYPDPDHKNGKNKKCYFLEDRFNLENLEYKNAAIKPVLQNQNGNVTEDVERVIKIGILNHYIYKDPSMHFLVKDKTSIYSVNCTEVSFLLNRSPQNEKNINLNIQVKNITDIDCNNKLRFETVDEAYKGFKKEFPNYSNYLIFGNDVEKGIKTIRNSAGPPERIFYYLQTLIEFCKYKRKIKTVFSDDYILEALGCDCSYENPEDMQIKLVRDERMFDNGNNVKKLFELHLKPGTFSRYEDTDNKKRTTRIYILWDENVKKVIVGWIGKHPYLPC